MLCCIQRATREKQVLTYSLCARCVVGWKWETDPKLSVFKEKKTISSLSKC